MAKKDKIDDGGPAFPIPLEQFVAGRTLVVKGMSLRDYLVGQALSGTACIYRCNLESGQDEVVSRAEGIVDKYMRRRNKK